MYVPRYSIPIIPNTRITIGIIPRLTESRGTLEATVVKCSHVRRTLFTIGCE